MSYSSTVTTKGQVTIPQAYRELLGLIPGRKIVFTKHPTLSKKLIIEPVSDFTSFRGVFKSSKKYSKKTARNAYLKDVLSGKI